MKRLLTCLVLVGLLAGCGNQPEAVSQSGKELRLSDYYGKWVVVSYWAPWCAACIRQLRVLDRFYRRQKKRVMVFGVSAELLSNDQLHNYQKKWGLHFPLMAMFSLEKIGVDDPIRALPVSFVVSPQGNLSQVLRGFKSISELTKALRKPR